MRVAPLALFVLALLPPVASASHTSPVPGDEIESIDGRRGVDWRAVDFAPDGSYALLVGRSGEGVASRDLIATWSASQGLVEVYNETGSGLVDVSFHASGTSLILGVEDTILLGTPGNYRNVWDDSEFAQAVPPLHFYGLRAGFQPGEDNAIVAGSSLLRLDVDGAIEVIHGGKDSFFRSLAWNPISKFAFVEVALERDGRALLGAVWRTSGEPPLDAEDNIAIYGRSTPGASLLNSIAFAPNGTYAVLAGRDGVGSSLLTWANHRNACHEHAGASGCHDHQWQYLPMGKVQGPITCIDFHPTAGYALTVGLERDVIGFVGTHVWAPLAHAGPQLLGCAFHPAGAFALAVGERGAIVRITPGTAPLAAVASPEAGALVAPDANTTFLVGVLDRGGGVESVSGSVEGGAASPGARAGPWWAVALNASALDDGEHALDITATTGSGATTFAHPFLVNNEAFTPARPEMRPPIGLEGAGLDANGVFTLRWRALDEPVVYEVQESSADTLSNTTRILAAGPRDNLTLRVEADGSYLYRVRAKNAFNVGQWSESLVLNVILDSDSDGVPDARDPRPYLEDSWGDLDEDGVADDAEYNQCSDPDDAASTPSTDDDGDGIVNGIECRQGSDPLDPDDPRPRENGDEPNGDDEGPEEDNGTPVPGLAFVVILMALVAAMRRRPR